MHACNEHVKYQLPNDHTSVGYVLDSIETSNAPILSDMANIKEDTTTTGNHNNF